MVIRRADRKFARGLMLMDLLIYLSLLAFIMILTAVVFDRFLKQSADLRRNISDVDRALKAGERWRADVRAATAAPQLNGNVLTIPQGDVEMIYTLGTNVTRRRANSKVIEAVISGVRTNQFIFEQRAHASVWRWELELEARRKTARVRPLFTFMAVAPSN